MVFIIFPQIRVTDFDIFRHFCLNGLARSGPPGIFFLIFVVFFFCKEVVFKVLIQLVICLKHHFLDGLFCLKCIVNLFLLYFNIILFTVLNQRFILSN